MPVPNPAYVDEGSFWLEVEEFILLVCFGRLEELVVTFVEIPTVVFVLTVFDEVKE